MASRTAMIYLLFTAILALLACTATAIRSPANRLRDWTNRQPQPNLPNWLPNQQQAIMPENTPNTMAKPSSTPPDSDVITPQRQQQQQQNRPIVSDVLPKTRAINIFASLTRNFESVASRLGDASQNVTVLAPRNNAIQGLPRKPWENPEEYEQFGAEAYEGEGGQGRADQNLRRFVEAHIVPVSPWKKGEEVVSLGGGRLKWMKEGDRIFVQPGDVEVDSIVEQVSNGEVWVLNGVVNYS